MKKLITITLFFCMFFGKNVHAQTHFTIVSDPYSGKKVLYYEGSTFLGSKEHAKAIDHNAFDDTNNTNILVFKESEGGKMKKSIFIKSDYRWFLVKDNIMENFTVSIESRDVTTIIHILYNSGSTEDISF